jgi:hypothetical protein
MKEGDVIIINKDLIGKGLRKGSMAVVAGVYGIDVLVDYFSKLILIGYSDADLVDKLPIGTQLELGPVHVDSSKCDCGGYKTYGSMEPEYHSETLPCSSLKK